MRLTWVQPEDLITHEFRQAAAEGRYVQPLLHRWIAAGGSTEPPVSGATDTPVPLELRALALELLEEIMALPAPEALLDQTWDEVLATLPTPTLSNRSAGSDLAERVAGAWHGRAAGCLLGKPVEKIPREGIEAIARATGRWPITKYFTAVGLPQQVATRWPWNRRSAPTSLEENIAGMPEDDDLNYPMLALRLLENNGPGFTVDDVAQLWLDNLGAGRVFTAERVAYRNLLLGVSPDKSGKATNPFREWIGALIRGDVFGWINPGKPLIAAQLAWKDAWLSHRRNGCYGELWAAALASAALVSDSIDEVFDRAGVVIPIGCALAEAIEIGRSAASSAAELSTGLDVLHERYGHLHWVHVLNNAATIAFALTWGRGDFTASIGAGVSAGWDTDSVCATIGGIVGALRGRAGIDEYWLEPIGDVLHTSLPGGDTTFTALIERTLQLSETTGQGEVR